MIIRKAKGADQSGIASCIAEGFQKDFALLCKDTERVAKAICPGVQSGRFYVAEIENQIAGVAAVSDCTGRAVLTDGASYRKHFGLINGAIAKLVLKEEFEKPLDFPSSTGFIEFVAVRQAYRRKGVATAILKECLNEGSYQTFVLDVINVNTSAIRCYTQLGFQEWKRVKEKHGKQKGYDEKIFMRYER